MAEIQRAVRTPIATGERVTGLHGFRDLLAKQAASILQPDITHCGGLTEARRIAALCEAYRVALAPHNPQGPVSTAASLEFAGRSFQPTSQHPRRLSKSFGQNTRRRPG